MPNAYCLVPPMNPTQVVEDIVTKQLKAAKDVPDFTIGDTVNVAQRLEDAARGVGSGRAVTIVASDAVVARAGRGFRFNELGQLPVRGRREPVSAFEVSSLDEDG